MGREAAASVVPVGSGLCAAPRRNRLRRAGVRQCRPIPSSFVPPSRDRSEADSAQSTIERVEGGSLSVVATSMSMTDFFNIALLKIGPVADEAPVEAELVGFHADAEPSAAQSSPTGSQDLHTNEQDPTERVPGARRPRRRACGVDTAERGVLKESLAQDNKDAYSDLIVKTGELDGLELDPTEPDGPPTVARRLKAYEIPTSADEVADGCGATADHSSTSLSAFVKNASTSARTPWGRPTSAEGSAVGLVEQRLELAHDAGASSLGPLVERRVHFDLAATTVYEVVAYAEIYGIHPRYFDFDRDFWLVPSLGLPGTPSAVGQRPMVYDVPEEENDSNSDSGSDEEEWVECVKFGEHIATAVTEETCRHQIVGGMADLQQVVGNISHADCGDNALVLA